MVPAYSDGPCVSRPVLHGFISEMYGRYCMLATSFRGTKLEVKNEVWIALLYMAQDTGRSAGVISLLAICI